VLAYGVRLRTREFGIRIALGAEQSVVRRMVLGRGFILTGIGMVAGAIGALLVARVMASVVFHASPLDPMVLLGAAGFLGVVAAAAAYLPARRATSVDPIQALE
jgi:putative ABC transport system permease protein